jgi:D-tyrosyl-tRNA(Tyr) deacylase
MRAVVQRVKRAEVRVGSEVTGRIDAGLCVLVGVADDDTEADSVMLADKVCQLRVMNDEAGKMNKSVLESAGAILAVSQFTLHGDARRGRRPSFARAMAPMLAEPLFDGFCAACRAHGVSVGTGRFGAEMLVEILGDGPVTILLDTRRTF